MVIGKKGEHLKAVEKKFQASDDLQVYLENMFNWTQICC